VNHPKITDRTISKWEAAFMTMQAAWIWQWWIYAHPHHLCPGQSLHSHTDSKDS